MMIVDLIDGDDFRHRLVALGVHIPEGAGPDTCARMALCRHQREGVAGLKALVDELVARSDIVLPSVRQAIEHYLLPALSQTGSDRR